MLGCWKPTASVINITTKLLHEIPNLLTQQTRNTYILKRKYPLRLHKKGGQLEKFTHKDFIYEVIEKTELRKVQPIDVILTQFVEGVGNAGDKVSFNPQKAYNEFLLPGLAVYASPENIEKYIGNKQKTENPYSSIYAPITIKRLKVCCLIVNMSQENPWTVEKWHIRSNFRRIGIVVPDEAITLSERKIEGPNMDIEGKEFYVTVTVNNAESTYVRCRIHHCTYHPVKIVFNIDDWKGPREAIFPEDQEILDSLPKPLWDTENVEI